MLYIETVTIGGRQYRRTYSDTYKIARDGVEYDEAIDPIDIDRTYIETDTPKQKRRNNNDKNHRRIGVSAEY